MPTTLEQIQYGFDRDSRRTWKRRALTTGEDDHYRYDALSQVAAAARGNLNLNLTAIGGRPASEQSWDYDPTGNWRGFDAAENGNPVLDQHRVHDRGNRLTQIEGNANAMILDRAGRMRQATPDADGDWNGKLELTWDAWSRVTGVKSNGETVGEYAYDGLTRRTTREVSGVTWHSFYSDQWRPLEERKDAETTASAQYLWGARHRDDLVRRDRAVGGTTLNETRYALMDYFSAAAITDEDGEVKERYAYSAFGVRRVLTPEFTTRTTSECGFEFGFQGQFLDAESGLYNYGYRYYSPHLGRWMCKDPIEEKGGTNIFAIANNRAVNRVDRFGLIEASISPIDPKNPTVVWAPLFRSWAETDFTCAVDCECVCPGDEYKIKCSVTVTAVVTLDFNHITEIQRLGEQERKDLLDGWLGHEQQHIVSANYKLDQQLKPQIENTKASYKFKAHCDGARPTFENKFKDSCQKLLHDQDDHEGSPEATPYSPRGLQPYPSFPGSTPIQLP